MDSAVLIEARFRRTSGQIAGAPVRVVFGGGGGSFRGRALGFGLRYTTGDMTATQFFRVDYHNKHGKGLSDIDYMEYTGSKYSLHVHTRKN